MPLSPKGPSEDPCLRQSFVLTSTSTSAFFGTPMIRSSVTSGRSCPYRCRLHFHAGQGAGSPVATLAADQSQPQASSALPTLVNSTHPIGIPTPSNGTDPDFLAFVANLPTAVISTH